ncbi:MAG: hypothetical protein ACOCYG_04575 [Spirochaetota bacterium]
MTHNFDEGPTAPERSLPIIRRAREYHLYDGAGRRYLDLYQDGGRTIFGHRPGGLTTRIKNELSRGLMMQIPHGAEQRLTRRLLRRYPQYRQAALIPAPAVPEALSELAALVGASDECVAAPPERVRQSARGHRYPAEAVHDPAVDPEGAMHFAALVRPFLPVPEAEVLLPVLPVPGGLAAQAVVVRCDPPGIGELFAHFPPQAPFVVRAFEHALGQVEVAEGEESAEIWDEEVVGALWASRGPYLRFQGPSDRYHEVFRRYLEEGYIVNPEVGRPSIVPRIYSEGERKGFRRATESIAGRPA